MVLLGIGAAHGGEPELAPFVGDWALTDETRAQVQCDSVVLPAPAGEYSISISPGTGSDLEFHLACHCSLPLQIVGRQARLVAPTECNFILIGRQIKAVVDDLIFDLSTERPNLTIRGNRAEGLARPPFIDAAGPCSFAITGPVSRESLTPSDCGPDDTAVGVLATIPDGVEPCKPSPGREAVDIIISTNKETTCLYETGASGEGPWALPQAERPPMVCKPDSDPNTPHLINLPFCRVDGRRFKPLTSDANDTEQSYAVLKLGSQCPNGSTEMIWQLDTPNEGDQSSCAGAAPDAPCGPNQAFNQGGDASSFYLHFCVFQSASSDSETMAEFPDLGRAYGVFHAFKRRQPSWVLLKRWIYGPFGLGTGLVIKPAVPAFSEAVEESADHGIYFNVARVR